MLARLTAVVGLAILAPGGPSFAGERPELTPHRGSVDATLLGRVTQTDRDIYPINARPGQTLSVAVESLQGDAVFQIYPPGTSFFQDSDDIWTFHGRPVRGADGRTQQWSGPIQSGGRYLIVVGGGGGQTDYSLQVTID
jgi:hypothetical protein